MTEWLVRHFVNNFEDTANPSVRTHYGQFAGIVGIICNVLLCLGKGTIGLISGSLSIVADAVNNLSDAASNIVSLLGFKLASKPADPGHPYGHGRYEYLAGLVVAALVMTIGINLSWSSIQKILAPTPTEFSGTLVAVLVLSIAVKLWMAVFNRTIGHKIDSDTLIATATDSRNDVISTAAVLACAIISKVTNVDLDGWAGLAVGIFIIWSAVGLLGDAIDPLLGQAPSAELVEHIRKKIMSYPGVLGTHDLMVHDYGPGRQFASAHVEMAAEADPLESHDLIDNIEQDFKNDDHMIVTLHYDPIVTNDPTVNDMRNWINQAVKIIDSRLTIHDLRTVPGPTHTNVIFDCVKPFDLDLTDTELTRRVDDIVREHYHDTRCVITVDASYVSSAQ